MRVYLYPIKNKIKNNAKEQTNEIMDKLPMLYELRGH
jgi:hypothetical protein